MVKKVNKNRKLIINEVIENNINFIYFKKSNLTLNCFIVGKVGRSWTNHQKEFKLPED